MLHSFGHAVQHHPKKLDSTMLNNAAPVWPELKFEIFTAMAKYRFEILLGNRIQKMILEGILLPHLSIY